MPNKTPKLALAEILQNDADEIIAARKTGRAIYETNDISAAGNQVEEAVRKVLRRKLSQLYVSLRRAGLTFPKHYQPGAPKVTKRK